MIYLQKRFDQINSTMACKSNKRASHHHFLMMVRFFNTDLIVCEFFYKLLFVMVLNASKIG